MYVHARDVGVTISPVFSSPFSTFSSPSPLHLPLQLRLNIFFLSFFPELHPPQPVTAQPVHARAERGDRQIVLVGPQPRCQAGEVHAPPSQHHGGRPLREEARQSQEEAGGKDFVFLRTREEDLDAAERGLGRSEQNHGIWLARISLPIPFIKRPCVSLAMSRISFLPFSLEIFSRKRTTRPRCRTNARIRDPQALRNGQEMTPSPSSSLSESLDLYPDSPHTHPVHTAYSQLSPQDYRPRASSNASSCGRLSPIPAIESDMHDSQVRHGQVRHRCSSGECLYTVEIQLSLIFQHYLKYLHVYVLFKTLIAFGCVLKLPDAAQGTAHVPWHRRMGRGILAPPRPPAPTRPRPVRRPVSGLDG